MIKHLLGIFAVIALIALCTFLPFFPGGYDSLAIPLSSMAQVFGVVGLILVPLGLVWIASERSQRFAERRFVFSVLSLIAFSVVWAAVSLIALIQSGFALTGFTVALWAYVVIKVWPNLKRKAVRPSALSVYLVAVPVAVALLQFTMLERAVEFSRNRAILNSAPLIAAIEQYRTANGRYPTSLLSVAKDYKPDVIGIKHYEYEPHGDAYNLVFEQFTYRFGTQEFVVYNPRDEHVMTVHAMDILQMTPAQLAIDRTRGHYALHDSSHSHWKYYWFD